MKEDTRKIELQEEGDWIRPKGRRREKFVQSWDNAGNRRTQHNNLSTTFNFTSFLENMRAKELYAVFKKYGEIDEVIIPARKNKRGKKFGFIRFFDVQEASVMATKLDNIFIGDTKLFVNIPRYDRNLEARVVAKTLPAQHKAVKRDVGKRNVLDGRSFAAVVSNRVGQTLEKKAQLEYSMKEEIIWQRFRGAFVGEVRHAGLSYY